MIVTYCMSGRNDPYRNVGKITANSTPKRMFLEKRENSRVSDFFPKGKQKAIPDLELGRRLLPPPPGFFTSVDSKGS
jgi:hypothetical protein